ncbi:hypothetical protein DVR12_16165 [Chitinophaga silvatica]|uniref:Glycosyl hydrolase 36 catalytic domain-containing protein n=2 Tax=Chitinophaga silvatica TaxID=2282649 RepID=A0A3E1Y8B8_9BACT|nr:hypothetical protein DVR12_16165 [Chitinophaga silvatica]
MAASAQQGELKLLSYPGRVETAGISKNALAKQILADNRLDTVQAWALKVLTGFNAGTGYGEIWIRDFNTFIKGSLKVRSSQDVKDALLLFFKLQGADGNIPDGAINEKQANIGYNYAKTDLAPGWASHKNTVETDQESSLIQAVKQYIDVTGDKSILQEKVGDQTVLQRMDAALRFVLTERWAKEYGLVKGATTIDWGDVQPENGWGVALNEKTKWSIDIYDNAMFLLAINNFLAIKPASYTSKDNWKNIAASLKKNIRKYLWDAEAGKYIPHIYLNGSPFPPDFNERQILYTGGTACAILAGLHDQKEIKQINQQFLNAAEKETFATIGMTVYPPYPVEVFPNMPAYFYQNAGDWTWFGGRMITALANNGLQLEAYAEMSPMIDRVISNKGFYEWYDVRNGKASGSGDFRGEAGVLYDAINNLRAWARKVK